MERIVLWIRRVLTVVVVLLFMFWAALRWSTYVRADNFVNGIGPNTEEIVTMQERWLCAAAMGPSCLILDPSVLDQEAAAAPTAPGSAR